MWYLRPDQRGPADGEEACHWELTDEPDHASPSTAAPDAWAAIEAAMASWPVDEHPDADIEVVVWQSEEWGDTSGWVRLRDGGWEYRGAHSSRVW